MCVCVCVCVVISIRVTEKCFLSFPTSVLIAAVPTQAFRFCVTPAVKLAIGVAGDPRPHPPFRRVLYNASSASVKGSKPSQK